MGKLTQANITNWFDLASYEDAESLFKEQIREVAGGPEAIQTLGDLAMLAGVLLTIIQKVELKKPPPELVCGEAQTLIALGMVFQARVIERAMDKAKPKTEGQK